MISRGFCRPNYHPLEEELASYNIDVDMGSGGERLTAGTEDLTAGTEDLTAGEAE